MSTVQTLLNRAGRLLGVVASNTAMGTNESADALVALNSRLDSWNNERLLCYATQTEALTLSASTASYTIGPGGALNTVRPVSIEAAWIVDSSNISHDVAIITDDDYDGIEDKTTTADWPSNANYRATMSTGTLYVYRVPNATRTMNLRTRVVLTAFASVATTVTLPPGWDLALTAQLAIDLAPEYPNSVVTPELMMMARSAKTGIKSVNAVPVNAYTELVALTRPLRGNILTGP